ncbi:IclR family transcriptional regulator domain-containing protein [Sphaerotilus mobilis]|nr:IclR family transcriptional regulator C-terminal domain-containing protein [Sphaerotilus mobilis]
MPSETPPTPENADGPSSDTGSPRDFVAALASGLLVIEAFDQDRPRLSISEVAQRAGLTRAAARRHLITLTRLGYAHQTGRQFALSAKVLRFGQSYMHSARLPRLLQPQLTRMALAMQEASSAGVLDGHDVISVAAATAGRVVSATLQPGTRVPAWCTANGRVLLAALPNEDLDAFIARQAMLPLTPQTLTQRDRLRLEIERVRVRGYALVDQELEPGLRTLAVPLRNFRGEVVAAINVSAHAGRMSTAELLDRCLPMLLEVQAHLRQFL